MEKGLIDYEKALNRIGGDNEFLFELLNDLIGQVDENLSGLKQAVINNDYENLRSLAHSLKGVSANLNVERLSAYFLRLEELSNKHITEGAIELLNLIANERNELEKFVVGSN